MELWQQALTLLVQVGKLWEECTCSLICLIGSLLLHYSRGRSNYSWRRRFDGGELAKWLFYVTTSIDALMLSFDSELR